MRKENGVLVLENEEDKYLLFDYFDDYVDYMNYDGNDEIKENELCDMLSKSRIEFFRGVSSSFLFLENVFDIFRDREEYNVTLFPKALKCLEVLDLVKVEYKKEPKYKLTKNTHTLLSMLDDYWIAKNSNGFVIGFDKKPFKNNNSWVFQGKNFTHLHCFQNVDFSFLHWEDEEPTRISDILADYEIIEEE